jgi:hypothetical protein
VGVIPTMNSTSSSRIVGIGVVLVIAKFPFLWVMPEKGAVFQTTSCCELVTNCENLFFRWTSHIYKNLIGNIQSQHSKRMKHKFSHITHCHNLQQVPQPSTILWQILKNHQYIPKHLNIKPMSWFVQYSLVFFITSLPLYHDIIMSIVHNFLDSWKISSLTLECSF